MFDFSSFQTLRVETIEPFLLLATLSRPEAANAVDARMAAELLSLFEQIEKAPQALRCLVLTGAGQRAFCAGADLKERRGQSTEDWSARHKLTEKRVRMMAECPVPVIAAVNGAAYAGGCELALSCDFIYASTTARFALTETTLGIMPGAGGTQNLTRAVGSRRAKEIIFTGRPFSAQEAADWGVVNRLFEPGELISATLDAARAICRNAPLAIRQAKTSIGRGQTAELSAALNIELECYLKLISTSDRLEGAAAYAEKRPPCFLGT